MQVVLIAAIMQLAGHCAYGFEIFDGVVYKHKPDMSRYGIKPILILYDDAFWDKGEDKKELNRKKIVETAKKIPRASIVCIDIEHLGADKLKEVAVLIKKNAPQSQIGFYGIPLREYWASLAEKSSQQYKDWVNKNEQYIALIQEVDILFPSLYTFYPFPEQWEKYAIENIKQAKIYGKPVYPFLWPQYHDSTILKGSYINGDLWRLELETCYKYADGIVMWGGWDMIAWKAEDWKDDAIWWAVTQKFIASNKI
ncbi:MAG TPA: hypothetical protein VL197_02165 [Nitrospirota bacterium]|nr:hypothetical protein [Nitrospirota bacterium]